MIHNFFLKQIENQGTHKLLTLICCLIAMLGGLLVPSNSHAIEKAEKMAEIVAQLFKLDSSETYYDYNDYENNPHWANIVGGYIGGHSGWDVQTKSVAQLASADEPFYSVTEGVVIRAGINDPDAFNTIAVHSDDGSENGITTLYLHARNTFVYLGQRVNIGSCLGVQGNTGLWPPRDPEDEIAYADNPESYSEHVHIEVRKGYHTKPARGTIESIDPIDPLYNQIIAATSIPLANADVNQDDVVNAIDAILIIEYLKENPQQFDSQLDVNGDRTIDFSDIFAIVDILYSQLCELVKNAAPSHSVHNLIQDVPIHVGQSTTKNIEVPQETIQEWLDIVREVDDGSLTFKYYIAMLESLLTTVVPQKTILLSNYPNPFNPETWIPYYLAKDTEVSVIIYDATGALIRQLDVGHQKAGDYTPRNLAVYWDGRSETGERVASGIYFYTLTTEDYTATRKMVILK